MGWKHDAALIMNVELSSGLCQEQPHNHVFRLIDPLCTCALKTLIGKKKEWVAQLHRMWKMLQGALLGYRLDPAINSWVGDTAIPWFENFKEKTRVNKVHDWCGYNLKIYSIFGPEENFGRFFLFLGKQADHMFTNSLLFYAKSLFASIRNKL